MKSYTPGLTIRDEYHEINSCNDKGAISRRVVDVKNERGRVI